ncbi:GNAT family N-acetyltransferase [Vibrio gangliei]|uniref:GNAT family N-acetyltransferase n=1 Tax=Vibrio gangliei TaxID=2077090 RepID=UPI000D0167FF|nr:GNAT family protein [Vibrio gangliei]
MFTLDVDDEIQLALVEAKFAADYFEIVAQQRDYLSQWLAWPPHAKDAAFFASFITQSLHDYADGKSLVCTVFYQQNLVGNISFNSINHQLKKVEIGYWLSQDYQGLGIITKSVSKLINVAFSELDMLKVQISVAVENIPSRKVCERLGFELEGVITQAENLNGRIVDHAVYGLQRENWG